MLLIKQTIDRYIEYKNDSHRDAVHDLVILIKERLDIVEEIPNQVQFLRTLIKDYIVLTR